MKKVQLHNKIEEIVRALNFLLVDTVIRGSEKEPVIEVFIDSASGVTSEDCADVSRKLHDYLDDGDIVNQSYRLDVSSPGIDRPLKFLEQFPKNIDRKFKVKYNNNETTSEFEGKLKSVNNSQLCFNVKEEEVILDFEQVVSAKVLISF
jgi:ribosome maturation factor RimP